ncbi:MAG: hypothetical protein OHK006_12710 [Thermodesulfovibrionales bacterium]
MKKSLVLAAAVLVCTAAAASAEVRSAGIDRRQAVQRDRIERGAADGALSPREQRLLVTEQRRITRAECRMKSDGRLSERERARLHRMQDRAGRHIWRTTHNGIPAHRR